MTDIRQQIAEFALAQKNKPYAEHGWGPHAYDCIGLFCRCGIEFGVLDYNLCDEEDPDLRKYTSQSNPPVMLKALKKYTVKVSRDEATVGDGLLFRAPKAQHLGVIVAVNPFYVVHASIEKMKVKYQQVRNQFYIVSGWRYPGLANG